jgi:type VI secretion system protein ImpA
MTQAYSMETASRAGIDFDVLLEPVPNDDNAGAGTSLRYEPVYQQIRDARHQDDASLPMGEWERPLVKADWKRVATLCCDALATRSKDFQLAAWLCEAWTHLHGVEGLIAGAQFTTALAEQYWQHAWPELEPGDADARVAPFVWLNETLARVLTLDLPLLTLEDREPEYVNLDEWQQVIAGGVEDEGAELTRELLARQMKKPGNREALAAMHRQLDTARAAWRALNALLDDRLGYDAPHLGRIDDTLARLLQAVTSLIGDQAVAVAATAPVRVADVHDFTQTASQETVMSATLHEIAATPLTLAPSGEVTLSRIENRAHAYQLLELVAAYLAENEPHSPTPFLLTRAVSWGRMPLPELMREVMRSEGGLGPYIAMLGIE